MNNRLLRTYEVNGPIAMMDCDKSFRYFVIGGRQNLQILEINLQAPYESMFTRRGMMKSKPANECQMARPAVNDLSWNKIQTEKIAVGSTAGMVSIYEITSEIRSRLIGMKKQHESNVSKVVWSPHSGNILVTASLENELKIWDIRVQNEALSPIIKDVTFESQRRIRDVKFSPHDEMHIALGYDSGGLQIFDTRKLIINKNGSMVSFLSEAPRANLIPTILNNQAHSKTVNSLDWNPTVRHVLASACLEKRIKVWDVSSSSMVEREKIEHVSSVSMIKWRTKQNTHIGASSLNDNQIYFYDTRYKFRPMSIFKGHTDVVKCFLYDPEQEYLVSASLIANSTNSSVVVQDFRNFIDPYETCPRLPVTVDPFNNVLFNLEDVGDIAHKKIQERELVLFHNHQQFNSAAMNQKEEFKFLNEQYIRTGSKEEISRHNSKVAEQLGKYSCAYLWRNIFTIAFPQSSPTYTIEALYEDKVDANVTITEDRIYLNEKSKYRKEVVPMDLEAVLQHLLDEDGELQTVAIAVLCLISMDKNILPELFVENILTPYIQLLRKFELYAVAVRTMLDSGLETLTRASNNYTQFKIGCGQCKESIKEGVACAKCKTIPLCILCQEPLDGLVVWCQYCAHGGHMKQYRNWFLKEEVCPYGCRHKCFTFK